MKNFKMKSPKLLKRLSFGLYLLLTLACSPPTIEGYQTDSTEKQAIGTPEKINYEIKVLSQSGEPLDAILVSLGTNSFEESGTTNSDGVTSLVGQRLGNEPLNFTFKGKDLNATQIIRHLPSTATDAALVFEVVNEHIVRFSHYSVNGLYR